jgi:hypothetical protein
MIKIFSIHVPFNIHPPIFIIGKSLKEALFFWEGSDKIYIIYEASDYILFESMYNLTSRLFSIREVYYFPLIKIIEDTNSNS